jgi:hypothetical protein
MNTLDLLGGISNKLTHKADLSSNDFQTFNRLNLDEGDYYRFKNDKKHKV